MSARILFPLALAAALAGCEDLLDLQPPDELAEEEALDAPSDARAALAGAYASLTSGSYYGGTLVFFGDLSADNATHTGTLQSYGDADRNNLRADNGSIDGMWASLYSGIARANVVIDRVPGVAGLRASERDQILGQAYFLRALHYHNLVRLWGGVPLVLSPVTSADEASNVTRATTAQVYAQILADLDDAATRLTDAGDRFRAGDAAVEALRSRVLLYTQDWAGAEAAARAVEAMGYTLAPAFEDLFVPDGATPEDILRVIFTPSDFNNIGYYYIGQSCGGGRGEVAPTEELVAAYDSADARFDWSFVRAGAELCGTKYPTTLGAEDVHVVRYAEVLLNLAESLAQQDRLDEAVDAYNPVRVRAGLAPHVLGVDVPNDQASVLAAVRLERRLELAMEGDRWPDLVRTALAVPVLGIPAAQTLYPIPQSELDVAPGLVQNPGY